MNETEKLIYLKTAIQSISEMSISRGISPIEQKYNTVIEIAKEVFNKVKD